MLGPQSEPEAEAFINGDLPKDISQATDVAVLGLLPQGDGKGQHDSFDILLLFLACLGVICTYPVALVRLYSRNVVEVVSRFWKSYSLCTFSIPLPSDSR